MPILRGNKDTATSLSKKMEDQTISNGKHQATSEVKEQKSRREISTGGEPTKNHSLSTPSTIGCIVVAAFSFVAGVFTPHFIKLQRVSNNIGDSQRLLQRANKYAKCDEDGLSNFLHAETVPGMHVVCLKQTESGTIKTTLFPGAQKQNNSKQLQVDIKSPSGTADTPSWRIIRKSLKREFDLPVTNDLSQPWAIFTPLGERIIGEEDEDSTENYAVKSMLESGLVIIFEGGHWLWPGVEVGFRRSVDLYSIIPDESPADLGYNESNTRTVILETISLSPLIVSVEGFLSNEECDHVKNVAEPSIRRSEVALMDKDVGKEATDWRTSQTTFISADNDNILLDLEYRVASLVRIPRINQEDLQVLRYGLGERYDEHTDYFDPDFYQSDEDVLEMIEYGRSNRMATVFWYLSDVGSGGETAFPLVPRHPDEDEDAHYCDAGLRVKPQKGKVIIFYSLTADGDMDEMSQHAACPVKEGLKWAANKWVWNNRQMERGYNFIDEDEYDDEIGERELPNEQIIRETFKAA